MSFKKKGDISARISSVDDSSTGAGEEIQRKFSMDTSRGFHSKDRPKKRFRTERQVKRKSFGDDEALDDAPKIDKYENDPELMKHACIRPRKADCFELNIKNSPQFSGDKYVGRFSSLEQAQAAAREILQSDDHLATIARISASNSKYKKGSGDSSDVTLDEPAPIMDYSGVESLMQADNDFCQEEYDQELEPI